jgi:hypothetical protein
MKVAVQEHPSETPTNKSVINSFEKGHSKFEPHRKCLATVMPKLKFAKNEAAGRPRFDANEVEFLPPLTFHEYPSPATAGSVTASRIIRCGRHPR